MIGRVKDYIDEYGMLEGVKSVLVGFSGGADSTALLLCLHGICRERSISLSALHVNHMIRGDEADRDEMHCADVCEALGVEFTAVRIDVPSVASAEHLGMEEAARRERYAAFERVCDERGIDRIAVAHNCGDNTETVLFNLIRGSGIRGLSGIPPVRGRIIRPLLCCSREEIVEFVAGRGFDYVTDSTNSEDEYTRNYIRHEIVPRLRKITAKADANILRSGMILRSEDMLLDELAEEGDMRLIRRSIMRRYEEYCRKNLPGRDMHLEARHAAAAEELVRRGVLWSEMSLPGGVKLQITRDGFEFLTDARGKDEKKSSETTALDIGTVILSGEALEYEWNDAGSVCVEKYCGEKKNIYKLSIRHTLNSVNINGMAFMRTRREGDTVLCGGMRKSVKKLLCEKKIDPRRRASLPFFCDDDGIFWIPGVAVRDGLSNGGDDIMISWNEKTY